MNEQLRDELRYLDRQVKMMRDTLSGHDPSHEQIVRMFKHVDLKLREILDVE